MAMVRNDPSVQTSIDMQNARAMTSFNVESVRCLLWNGSSEWEMHKSIVEILSKDPVFDKSQRYFMGRQELFRRGLAMTKRLGELSDMYNWSHRELAVALGLCDEPLALNLHAIAFTPPLLSQGSEDLISAYGALALNRGILGAYAQTELGHGTNVASVETTSTFLLETQEFQLHSPTITSYKWWIGGCGRVATHALVQARLILPPGRDMGPHLFLVQLRSMEDHRPLPGITVGDIGPKAFGAFPANDNGFIRFERVRIPRTAMLSKFASVSETGEYKIPPHNKLSYGGMLYIRSTMISNAGWQLAKAITIAIRYCNVRRQGGKSRQEQQVIRYPGVSYRLLPILSQAYVYILLGRNTTKSFEGMSQLLASGDTSHLAEMHAVLSALKVLVSTSTVESIEVARRSMGGHGFSAFAGVGRLYGEHVPSTTYEGDNFVLDEQVVRAALKAYIRFQTTSISFEMPPSSAYLRLLRGENHIPQAWHEPERSILLLEQRAAVMVRFHASYDMTSDVGATQRTSKAVGEAFLAARVREILGSVSVHCATEETVVIVHLLHLYLLTRVEGALMDLLTHGLLRSDDLGCDPLVSLRAEIAKLCQALLPQAIGLTDAFGFTDWELDSALGVRDGNVYQELWRRVQGEPLNQSGLSDDYEEFIKPILDRGRKLASHAKL